VQAKIVERHDWVNALLGLLDAAFHLTEEEQAPTIQILRKLLDDLGIPGRSEPAAVPAAVAVEAAAHVFSEAMAGHRNVGLLRPIRETTPLDEEVTLDVWVEALVSMLGAAYTDLTTMERIYALKVFTELLVAIGVPDRAAYYYPDEVIRAYLEARSC
jgi:hypothetical protein